MNRSRRGFAAGTVAVAAVVLVIMPAAARQDVALKDLMPKGMVIGVAINQRQSDATDAAAVELITKQFNQISPENLLKFQPIHPGRRSLQFRAGRSLRAVWRRPEDAGGRAQPRLAQPDVAVGISGR